MGYVEDMRSLVGHRPLILVGSVVIVRDPAGRILLQQRKQPQGYWGLPGGLMELGESVEDTARRELMEEMNLQAGALKFIGIYSGPEYFVKLNNGDQFYAVTTAFCTDEVRGEMRIDTDEALGAEYFYIDQLPEHIVKSQRVILRDYIQRCSYEEKNCR